MHELPDWLNFLFVEGGRAELEEMRERWVSKGCSDWQLKGRMLSWIGANVFARLQNLRNDITESLASIWPQTYVGFDYLEQPFSENYSKSAILTARISLGLGLSLYAGFGILDLYAVPGAVEWTWMIRYAIICPFITLAFVLTFLPISHKIFQLIMSAVCLVSGYGIIAMIFLSEPSEIAYETYYAGLILVLIYLFTVVRVRLVNAIVVGAIIILGYEYVAVFFQDILATRNGKIIFLNNNFFFLSAATLSIHACSLIEKSMKDEYTMRCLIVEEVFQEIRFYFGIYELKDGDSEVDANVQKLLDFLTEKPRSLDDMLRNYYLYKISKLKKKPEKE